MAGLVILLVSSQAPLVVYIQNRLAFVTVGWFAGVVRVLVDERAVSAAGDVVETVEIVGAPLVAGRERSASAMAEVGRYIVSRSGVGVGLEVESRSES